MGVPCYLDPDYKDIVDDFCRESKGYLNSLQGILFEMEDDLSKVLLLEQFGQIIDRMMGAAKSLELSAVAIICELGKVIGYKSSQINDQKLINIVVAVLFDMVEILQRQISNLSLGQEMSLKSINTDAFTTRLKWLNEKFSNISRSSVAIGDVDSGLNQNSLDQLLAQLGVK